MTKCTRNCNARIKEHGEAAARFADLLGHDKVGHRTLHCLIVAGYKDVQAVAAVDPIVIGVTSGIGDVGEARIYDAVMTELGAWPRRWTIGLICRVFGDRADRFLSNVDNADPEDLPGIVTAWIELAEKVWHGEIVLKSQEWADASRELAERFNRRLA